MQHIKGIGRNFFCSNLKCMFPYLLCTQPAFLLSSNLVKSPYCDSICTAFHVEVKAERGVCFKRCIEALTWVMRKCSSGSVPFLFSICTFSLYHVLVQDQLTPLPHTILSFSPLLLSLSLSFSTSTLFTQSLVPSHMCQLCQHPSPPLHPPPLSPRAPDPPRAPPPPPLPLRGAGFVG